MIEVRDLKKKFGAQQVLNGVTFRIEPGDSVVVIGPSGCGKSVLLKHLIGLIRPDSGEIIIDDDHLNALDERRLLEVRRKFGMLFQSAALFDSLNVADNISFVLRRERKLSAKEIDERVEEVLEMVELPGTQKKKPSELSGGMRKRVGLARAIIYKPEILLYDEPTTVLDPVVSDSIDQLIIRVREKLNHHCRSDSRHTQHAARGPAHPHDGGWHDLRSRHARRNFFFKRPGGAPVR